MNPQRPCLATLSSHHGGNYDTCTRAGVVYQGSGRWLCKQHHIHGTALEGEDHSMTDAQRERMKRVVEGE